MVFDLVVSMAKGRRRLTCGLKSVADFYCFTDIPIAFLFFSMGERMAERDWPNANLHWLRPVIQPPRRSPDESVGRSNHMLVVHVLSMLQKCENYGLFSWHLLSSNMFGRKRKFHRTLEYFSRKYPRLAIRITLEAFCLAEVIHS